MVSPTSRSALLDIPQAAAYLSTTPRHVQRLWAERRIAGVKLGRKLRFAAADLDAFIAANRVEAVR